MIYICPICGERLKRMFSSLEVVQPFCEHCNQEIIPLATPDGRYR